MQIHLLYLKIKKCSSLSDFGGDENERGQQSYSLPFSLNFSCFFLLFLLPNLKKFPWLNHRAHLIHSALTRRLNSTNYELLELFLFFKGWYMWVNISPHLDCSALRPKKIQSGVFEKEKVKEGISYLQQSEFSGVTGFHCVLENAICWFRSSPSTRMGTKQI